MQYRDYYKELDVERTASDDDIKKAYRRLARKYHPDVSKEADAEARFKAINEAYEVLRDKDRRAAYDNLGQNYHEGQRFRPPPDWGGQGFGSADDAMGEGGFSDFFESLFGGRGFRGATQGGARRARSIRATIALTLEQIFHGGPQRITLNGRTYDVRIPAGIAAGQVIRLAGQGPDGGDVLLEVAMAPHARYEVDGRDIIGKLSVTPWQAALGAGAQVDTLGGSVTMRIPAGARTGQRLRLKGRGLPGGEPGDHYVRIEIQAPTPANDAQREAYQQLAKAFGQDA